MAAISTLPRIIKYDGVHDSGEFGNASCPHCGAAGRYVYSFVCEDGKRHGAMAGCIKLFPVAPIAKEHAKILAKEKNLKEGRKLNRWDTTKLAAIEAFYAGEKTEDEAQAVITEQNRQCRAWVATKYGRR